MKAIRRFEDLIAWQKARLLTRVIYQTSRQGTFGKDFELGRQVRRASVSIMSNIAEGFERGGRAEFHQFLSTAKASCAEVRSQLYIALDAGHLNQPQFAHLLRQAEEVARFLGGLRAAVGKQRDTQRGKSSGSKPSSASQSSVLSPHR